MLMRMAGIIAKTWERRVHANSIETRAATSADVPLLAAMNHQLIRDEGSRNSMTPAELAQRMRGWLRTDWKAEMILVRGDVIGYALFQFRRDEYVSTRSEVYIRQFFIQPEYRRRGLGRAAFEKIAQTRFPVGAILTLEVLETNGDGRDFWEALGFGSYCTTLKRT